MLTYLDKAKKLYVETFLKKHAVFIKEIDYFKKLISEGWKDDQTEFQKLLLWLWAQEDVDPQTARLLKCDLYRSRAGNNLSAKKELISLIRDFPNLMDAYIKYWVITDEELNIKEMDYISEKMMKRAEKPNIPTSYWVEAITIRARTLIA